MHCLKVSSYASALSPEAISSGSNSTSGLGGKEQGLGVNEQFADVFAQLDQRDFVEVVGCRLHVLFKGLQEEGELMHVVAHLLGTPATAKTFTALMLGFLTQHKLELLSNMQVRGRRWLRFLDYHASEGEGTCPFFLQGGGVHSLAPPPR